MSTNVGDVSHVWPFKYQQLVAVAVGVGIWECSMPIMNQKDGNASVGLLCLIHK